MKILTEKVGTLLEDAEGKLFIWTGNELRELKRKVIPERINPPFPPNSIPAMSGSLYTLDQLCSQVIADELKQRKPFPTKKREVVLRPFIQPDGKIRCWTSDWYLDQHQTAKQPYFYKWAGSDKTVIIDAVGRYVNHGL